MADLRSGRVGDLIIRNFASAGSRWSLSSRPGWWRSSPSCDSTPSGSRIPLLLLALVRDARAAGALSDQPLHHPLPDDAAAEANHLAVAIDLPDIPGPILLRAVIAWSQLFGMVSFEVFGQLTGAFTDNTPFFTVATDLMASFVGFQAEQ